ncbi:hypothetical protein ACQ4LE_002871, partial [Meloidogyne hapla]
MLFLLLIISITFPSIYGMNRNSEINQTSCYNSCWVIKKNALYPDRCKNVRKTKKNFCRRKFCKTCKRKYVKVNTNQQNKFQQNFTENDNGWEQYEENNWENQNYSLENHDNTNSD